MKNYILLFVMVAFLNSFSIGQQSVKKSDQQQAKKEWKLVAEKNGIQVYSVYENCDDNVNDIHQENAVLKFVNTTDQKLAIAWDLKIWYNGECINCDKNESEHHFAIQLNAGETKKGSCENRNISRELLVFSKFLNMENKYLLTKFELQNINVNPVN